MYGNSLNFFLNSSTPTIIIELINLQIISFNSFVLYFEFAFKDKGGGRDHIYLFLYVKRVT